MADSDLSAHRMKASLASGGTSSNRIHECAIAALEELKDDSSLLEYGAGTGALARTIQLARPGVRVVAADLFPKPENWNDDSTWIQADLNSPLPLNDSSFDWVVTTEVIEHLENPRAMARELARILRPGGRVVLTTPNQESIRSLLSLIFGGHFVAFLDSAYPAHITALLRKDLSRIFTECGFENIEFSYTDEGGVPKAPRILWQTISGGILKGRLFSDNLVMTCRNPKS